MSEELPTKKARLGEPNSTPSPHQHPNASRTGANSPPPATLGSASQHAAAMPLQSPQTGLLMMMLDAEEDSGGVFRLWGITGSGQRAMVRVPDFHPYFYIPCPLVIDKYGDGGASEVSDEDVSKMQHLLNCRCG